MVVVCRVMELAPVTLMGCDLGMTVEHFKLSRKILSCKEAFFSGKGGRSEPAAGITFILFKEGEFNRFSQKRANDRRNFSTNKKQNDQYVVTY